MNKIINDDFTFPIVFHGTTPWGNYLSIEGGVVLYREPLKGKWERRNNIERMEFVCNKEDIKIATDQEHQLYYDIVGISKKPKTFSLLY